MASAGSDNLVSGKGAESNSPSLIPDCSDRCHQDAYKADSPDTNGLDHGNVGLNGARADKGEGGMGIGDMMRDADKVIDSVPDQIADSQEQMIGGKGSDTRAWSPKEKELDIKADDPYSDVGKKQIALFASDGKAYGIGKVDPVTEKARQIADGIVLDGKDPRKYS